MYKGPRRLEPHTRKMRQPDNPRGCVVRHGAVRGCSSAMVDQLSPGVSTWIISGVAAIASGIHAMAVLKCSECTCASPAARFLKASSNTNWLGLSTLLDNSKKTLLGSASVEEV